MFLHIYKYRLLCLLRCRDLVFWTLLFPILMGILFHFALGSITANSETFSPVPAAIVENGELGESDTFRQVLDQVSQGDGRILDLRTAADITEAAQLLENGEIVGYFTLKDGVPELTVRQSGLQQTILKTFLDDYLQQAQAFQTILAQNPQALQNGLLEAAANGGSYIESVPGRTGSEDTILNYFYALIAMTCLYGGFWGMRNMNEIQADLSSVGARRCVAPTHKLRQVLGDAAAALTIHFGEVLLTLCFLRFVLGVSFSGQVGYVLLTCLAGCVAGVSFGAFLGAVIRKGEGVKIALLITISLTLSFLSGMMFAQMRSYVAQHLPLLSYLNPAALLTDAFYCLSVFDGHARYFMNIGILFAISAVFCLGSYLSTRRQQYASI
jgi:ABC-2 type transport system permease protein